MAGSRKLIVEIVGDSRNLERNLGRATKSTKGFEIGLKSLAKTVGLVFGAATVVNAFEDIIKVSQDAAASQAQTAQAFKNAGLSAADYGKQLEAVSKSAVQLGFDDEEAGRSLSKFVTAGQSVKTAMKEVTLAQDLARYKGIELSSATLILTGALAGNQRALRQLGIAFVPVTSAVDALREAHKRSKTEITAAELAQAKLADKQKSGASILEILNQKIHGQADAYSKTTAGAMLRFRESLENMEEDIGAKLLPTMTKWINYVTDHLPQIQKFIGDVADKAKSLWAIADKVAGALGGWKTIIGLLVAIKAAAWVSSFSGGFFGAKGVIAALTTATNQSGKAGLLGNLRLLTAKVWVVSVAFVITEKLLSTAAKKIVEGFHGLGGGSALGGTSGGHYQGEKPYWEFDGVNWWYIDSKHNIREKVSGPGVRPTVNAGGKAGAKRGYGGAGSVFQAPRPGGAQSGGGGHDPSQSFLGGAPAGGTEHDWMATAGTTVLAPEAGVCYAHGGHAPSTGIHKGNVFGWSLFFYGDSGTVYAGTHLAKVYPGRKQSGDPIGVVGGYPGWKSHLHWETKGGGSSKIPQFGPDPNMGGGGAGGGGGGGGRTVTAPKPAPPMFSTIGKSIVDTLRPAGTAVYDGMNKIAQAIRDRAEAIRQAILKARTAVQGAFTNFSSGVMSAFDAINAQWKSPAAEKLRQMQAEDTLKAAQQAYADAVAQYGADSPEAKAAARALEETKLAAQAEAEQEAHDKKVKADRDALQKQLDALYKEAGSAKTKQQAAAIRKKINDLLAQYGITPDTVAAATDWQTAQTLFVSSLGNLVTSLDALTAAISGKKPGAAPPGYQPAGFAAGGAIPIIAHAGEYVIRSDSARRLGANALNYINATGRLPRFQSGGALPGLSGDELLGDAEYAQALREKHGKWLSPRHWPRDLLPTAAALKNMLERQYGDAMHFESAWPQALYGYSQHHGSPLGLALQTPPNSISNATWGQVWYDFPGGKWSLAALGALAGMADQSGSYSGAMVGRALGSLPPGSGTLPPGGYPEIPMFARGGVMPYDGLAYLHAGETVSRRGEAQEIHVHIGEERIIAKIEDGLVNRGRRGGPIVARVT